ncbi:MAG: hypothetical protein QXZ44_03530 [Ferroplasma sp.]
MELLRINDKELSDLPVDFVRDFRNAAPVTLDRALHLWPKP